MSEKQKTISRQQPAQIRQLTTVSDIDILVFSDSHGDSRLITRCINAYPEAGLILHLGDHESSLQTVMRKADRPFLAVAGNCDWLTADDLPHERFFRCAGVGIYMCHGHQQQVKRGCGELLRHAVSRTRQVDLILFGHTHVPLIRTEIYNQKRLTLANPGAAGRRFSTGKVTAMVVRVRAHKLQDIWHLNQEAKPFTSDK